MAIQKHVMREIGVKRRRPERMESKMGRSMMPVPKTRELHLENRKIMGFLTGRDSIPLSVSGGGRLNPFTSCPVPMTTETLFLVDYGEFARRVFLLQRRLGFIHRATFASASEETADNPANTCLDPRLRPFSHTWLPTSLSDPHCFTRHCLTYPWTNQLATLAKRTSRSP